MANVLRTVYTDFASGELNPLLITRTDASAYFHGAKTLRNWYLLDEGGLMRRPGTTYKASLVGESRFHLYFQMMRWLYLFYLIID